MTFFIYIDLKELEILRSPGVQDFMKAHALDDPSQLVLSGHKYPDIPIKEVAAQIQARRKAKSKFPEWYQTEGIIFPPALSVEQASSEITARYKSELVSGNLLADLTGGMGVDTFYLSQNFRQSMHIEQQEALYQLAGHNFRVLGADIACHHAQAEDFLADFEGELDCIYIDPARRDENQRKVFRLEDCTPDVTILLPQLLAKAKQVLIKTAPLMDIHAAQASLQHIHKIVVLAVNQECKEVLYLLERGYTAEPTIETVHFHANVVQKFGFTKTEEDVAKVAYAEPKDFIYEPNSAILKAGGFKVLAEKLGLNKLHPNSHLYTSETLLDDFPGRAFQLQSISKYKKKALKSALSSKQANISTRNFPESVAQIRKKTGLKEGGDTYVFATTDVSNQHLLLITSKV